MAMKQPPTVVQTVGGCPMGNTILFKIRSSKRFGKSPGPDEVANCPVIGTENIILNGNDITLKNNAALDFGAVGKGAALDACLSYLSEND